MNEETVPKPYSLESQARFLWSNSYLSDVTLIVGPEKDQIRAHKFILSMASPYFEKLFFGELKTDSDQIEMDNITRIGLTNVLKYIYGYGISFDLSNLYETYVVGDMCLVYHFKDELAKYLKGKVEIANSCLVYDQLLKFETDVLGVMEHVKSLIQLGSKTAFDSEFSLQIHLETLQNILQLECLKIDETELLRFCIRWSDLELRRMNLTINKENRQMIFSKIKNLIRFTDMNVDFVGLINEIDSILTNDEIASLFLHLHNKLKPLSIECKTLRSKSDTKSSDSGVFKLGPASLFQTCTYIPPTSTSASTFGSTFNTVPSSISAFERTINTVPSLPISTSTSASASNSNPRYIKKAIRHNFFSN